MYSPQDCEIRNLRDCGIRLVTAGDTRRGSARFSERTDQVHVGMSMFSDAADRVASLQIDWKPFS